MREASSMGRLTIPAVSGRYLDVAIKLIDIACILALLVTGVAGLVVILRYPPVVWVDLLFDDAYYYLGIVRNIVDHGVSSFLPPYSTNGYQPLWLIVLSASAMVFGTSNTSLVVQSYVMGFVLVMLFGFVSKKKYDAVFPALACAAYHQFATVAGMETTLVPVFAILYLSAKKWTSQGAFGALLFLARLDALSLVIAADVVSLACRKTIDIKKYLIIGPVLAAYVVFNLIEFGVPVPISGLAKSIGNVRGENVYVALAYYHASLYVIRMAIGLIVALLLMRMPLRLIYRDELLASVLALLMCVTYYEVNSGWPVWLWYFWPILLVMYFVSLEMLARVKTTIDRNGTVSVPVMLIAIAVLLFVAKPVFGFCMHRMALLRQSVSAAADNPSYGRRNVELVDYLKQQHPAVGTFIAMGDRAGSFGFFLGDNYRFIHTEGLVGPRAYYDALAADRGEAFIDQLGIDYLVVDRERVMTEGNVLGIVEPVQPLSARTGSYVLCFPTNAIQLNQSYNKQTRYLLDYRKKVMCPASIKNQFLALRQQYEGIKQFSFPTTE